MFSFTIEQFTFIPTGTKEYQVVNDQLCETELMSAEDALRFYQELVIS